MIRVARLWSHLEDGVPVLDDALGRAREVPGQVDQVPGQPHQDGWRPDRMTSRDEILRFLQGGSLVLRAAGLAEDWLAPDRPRVVPIGYRTDGTWLWSEELTHHVREHRVLPERDFLEHMRSHRFVAAPATDAAVAEAAELLGAPKP